jgi:alpha-glucuronidase
MPTSKTTRVPHPQRSYRFGWVESAMRRALLSALLAAAVAAHADDGHNGWLRYAKISNPQQYRDLPSTIVVLGDTPTDKAAASELQRGLASMLGRNFTIGNPAKLSDEDRHDTIVITSIATLSRIATIDQDPPAIQGEAFQIRYGREEGHQHLLILGGTPRSELYAVFHLLEEIASERKIPADERQSPSAPIRWVNQWDNLNGTIERGYAGRSIFFDAGHVRPDLTRVSEYGRLLASIGLNGCTVNNVNSDLHTLDSSMLVALARIADAFRPWGVRMSLSVDLSSPQAVGGLSTFDPLDPSVIAWWQKKVDEIYKLVPDFGGFVIKADSEGRVGPSQYHRTPAEAANTVARALAPHGGVVLYRGFVYNNHLDWNDLKADRARAGYDNFHALDGKFEPNVVIQIKHGPIDFQVREPVSPLFAALHNTNEAIELQTTQEYAGQQRHMVFLVPMWKTALDTDMRAENRSTPVKEIVEGKSFHRPLGGFVSVVNVGLDANWLHHPMAMANLYGFGKLAWNPDLTSEQIVDSWTRLTFGNDAKVVSTIDKMQLGSWTAYENYTGPLGLGTLTNILGVHYGPGIESAERNGWGQWLRADAHGIGMDRTVATGTGYIGQYPPELAAVYESLKTCPDNLLLFMHHVPYDYVLHSGKTVVQHVYDSHYAGAATAASYAPAWMQLKGLIDPAIYTQTLDLFNYQAAHAVVWRDAVTVWFERMSGIPDKLGRVGHYPNRIEAESMQLDGYTIVPGDPAETASAGKAVVCRQAGPCTLTTTLQRAAGMYDIAIQYYDLRTGVSHFELLLNGKPIAHWAADATLPPATIDRRLDGSTTTRYTLPASVALKPGDTITLRGTPDAEEPAPVDYIEITPAVPHS